MQCPFILQNSMCYSTFFFYVRLKSPLFPSETHHHQAKAKLVEVGRMRPTHPTCDVLVACLCNSGGHQHEARVDVKVNKNKSLKESNEATLSVIICLIIRLLSLYMRR